MVRGVAGLCCVLLISGNAALIAQANPTAAPATQTPASATTAKPAAPQGAAGTETAVKLTGDQLESLVAPIALYPDPLLSQSLVASTYPLELVQAQQWLAKNPTLKGDALTAEVEKQSWDPSVQATVVVPDLLKRLTEDITWTHNLGNAFLEQQSDVMDAVQRLRAKAKSAGKLDTTEQQKVETKVVETKTVIEIQPTSTQVVYVPTYSPTVIWGPPLYYPYPPIYYPPYPPGAAWIGFGVGVAVGIGISGGWGYGCGWGGGGNVYINNNNNFVRHNNINTGNINTGNINRGNSNWSHNPSHRGGAPYSNTATANRYGGSTRTGAASAGAGATNRTAGAGGASRPSGGATATSASRPSGSGGGDRVGSRSVPQTSTRSGGSSFSGSSGGSYGAGRASGSSSRGASSMGSRGGGGGGGRRR